MVRGDVTLGLGGARYVGRPILSRESLQGTRLLNSIWGLPGTLWLLAANYARCR